MKKFLTLAFAFVFMTGVAFAQDNTADINQEVDASDASITQQGSENDADVSQILGNDRMSADIYQEGNSNLASVTQQWGQFHEALVEQIGDANALDLVQDNTNTYTNVYQRGDGNAADIFQRSRLFDSSGDPVSIIELTQEGDGNSAEVTQDSESTAGNEAYISQTGNGSFVSVEQLGDGNYAEASHSGNGSIEQSQQGDLNTVVANASSSGEVTQTQIGDDNMAVAGDGTQVNQNSVVEQYQKGDDNFAEVDIWSGNGRTLDILQHQEGDGNDASIQGISRTNQVTQKQFGNDNYALAQRGESAFTEHTVDMYQRGDENVAIFTSNGQDNDMASIFQHGSENFGSIEHGAGDWASISQTGDSNTATITQSN